MMILHKQAGRSRSNRPQGPTMEFYLIVQYPDFLKDLLALGKVLGKSQLIIFMKDFLLMEINALSRLKN